MQITYDNKLKKFVIRCNFMENAKIAALPAKRYYKRTNAWHAQALARNSQFLLENLRQYMDDLAIEVATGSIERTQVKYVPFPDWYKFKTNPFDHQGRALNHTWGLDYWALFMEMGTGKSKVGIDYACAAIQSKRADVFLLSCPVSLKENWIEDQFSFHMPMDLPVFVVDNLTPSRKKKLIKMADNEENYIVVVGSNSLSGGLHKGGVYETTVDLVARRKYMALLDESHYAKGHDSNRALNLEQLFFGAAVRGIMTGTPTGSRGIMDLYQQFQVLNPEIIGMGDFYSFRARYALMGGYEGKQIEGFQNVDELMSLIKPYVFQVTKEEVLDLPDKVYQRRLVDMAPEQAKIYKEVESKAEVEIQDMLRGGTPIEVIVESVLAKYSALQQITGGFINYSEAETEDEDSDMVRRTAWLVEPKANPKIRELIGIASDHENEPIIVWAKYRNEIAQICQALRENFGQDCVTEFHGGRTPEERNQGKADFLAGRTRFFVTTQSMGAEGLTLNRAKLTVFFSNALPLIQRLQSEDRNHRIGQERSPIYIDLMCRGTKDVNIYYALRQGKEIAQYIREQMADGKVM